MGAGSGLACARDLMSGLSPPGAGVRMFPGMVRPAGVAEPGEGERAAEMEEEGAWEMGRGGPGEKEGLRKCWAEVEVAGWCAGVLEAAEATREAE